MTTGQPPHSADPLLESSGLVLRLIEEAMEDAMVRHPVLKPGGRWESGPSPAAHSYRDLEETLSTVFSLRSWLAALEPCIWRLTERLTSREAVLSPAWAVVASPLLDGPFGPLVILRVRSEFENRRSLEGMVELARIIRHLHAPTDAPTVSKDLQILHRICENAVSEAAARRICAPAPERAEEEVEAARQLWRDCANAESTLSHVGRSHPTSVRSKQGRGTDGVLASLLSAWFEVAARVANDAAQAGRLDRPEIQSAVGVSLCGARALKWKTHLDELLQRLGEALASLPVSEDWLKAVAVLSTCDTAARFGDKVFEWICSADRTIDELAHLEDLILKCGCDQNDFDAARLVALVAAERAINVSGDFYRVLKLIERLEENGVDQADVVKTAVAHRVAQTLAEEGIGIRSNLDGWRGDEVFPIVEGAFGDAVEFLKGTFGESQWLEVVLLAMYKTDSCEGFIVALDEWSLDIDLDEVQDLLDVARRHPERKGALDVAELLEGILESNESTEDDEVPDVQAANPVTRSGRKRPDLGPDSTEQVDTETQPSLASKVSATKQKAPKKGKAKA